jgi:hypothetical protein
MIYTHVIRGLDSTAESPLDLRGRGEKKGGVRREELGVGRGKNVKRRTQKGGKHGRDARATGRGTDAEYEADNRRLAD